MAAAEGGGYSSSQPPVVEDADAAADLVGRRVRVQGNCATIRWGPGLLSVPNKEGVAEAKEFVGVEYDEDGNGKHDGTFQGSRLFECRHGFGSFVKADKVEFGCTIQKALAEKYFVSMLTGYEAATKAKRTEQFDEIEYTDSKGKERTWAVELVGRYDLEKRQQRLEGFMDMSVAQSPLEWRYPELGQPDIWQGDWSLPNLKSLWLDQTLIEEWSEVVSIMELCPSLEWLSLTKTRLKPLALGQRLKEARGKPEVPEFGARLITKPYFCKVRTLVLNGSGVTWETILALDSLNVFPCLEHLHIGYNNLAEGVPSLEGFEPQPLPHLKSLVLDGNGVNEWVALRRALISFPTLEALHLNGNGLGESSEGLEELSKTTRRMTALFLNDNKFSTWQELGALACLGLLELKVQRIPLTEGDRPTASPMLLRQVLIALMPGLMRLNASEVNSKERTASERYFLSICATETSPVIKALAETCDVQANITRLMKIHGEIVAAGDATEEAQAARAAINKNLVEVRLRPVGVAIMDHTEQRKKVPHSMTITELKQLCAVLFKNKIPLDRIRLVLADPALPFGLPFDDDARELGFYGVGDGAEIRVDDIEEEYLSLKPNVPKKPTGN